MKKIHKAAFATLALLGFASILIGCFGAGLIALHYEFKKTWEMRYFVESAHFSAPQNYCIPMTGLSAIWNGPSRATLELFSMMKKDELTANFKEPVKITFLDKHWNDACVNAPWGGH